MEVMINKDIRSYKVKDIGPLTIKQALSIGVAAVLGYGVFFLEKNILGIKTNDISDLQIVSIMIVAIIPLLFGFAHPYGLSFKDWLLIMLYENILSPKIRVYESDFDYSKMELPDTPGIGDYEPSEYIKKKYTKEEQHEIAEWKGYK